jgi:hypothetical protein
LEHYSARTALKELKRAMKKEPISPQTGRHPKPEAFNPADELFGLQLSSRTVWDSGQGCYSVKAGCITMFNKLKGGN